MVDEATIQKLAAINDLGGKREGWVENIEAIRRDIGQLSEHDVQALVSHPDPVRVIEAAGREALLARMPSGVRASNDPRDQNAAQEQENERLYTQLRERERIEYRKMKGRVV